MTRHVNRSCTLGIGRMSALRRSNGVAHTPQSIPMRAYTAKSSATVNETLLVRTPILQQSYRKHMNTKIIHDRFVSSGTRANARYTGVLESAEIQSESRNLPGLKTLSPSI